MLFCRASFYLFLLTVLLVGFEQNPTYAQRRCCRPKQKPSCVSSSQSVQDSKAQRSYGACKCIDTVFYGFPGYYLHYARRYPDCSDCTTYTSIIHQATTILSSTNCNDGNCMPSTYNSVAGFCLSEAVDPKYDIDLRIMAPDYESRGYLMGWIELPNTQKIVARVLLIKLKIGQPGSQFTETFAFGLEAKELPSGTNDDLKGMKVTNYDGSKCLFQGQVLGDIPCYILTKAH